MLVGLRAAENVLWARLSHSSCCTQDGAKFWGIGQKLLHGWAPADCFSSIFQHLLPPLLHTLPLPAPSAHRPLCPASTTSPSPHLIHTPSLSLLWAAGLPLSLPLSLEHAFSSAREAISLPSQNPASSHFLWTPPSTPSRWDHFSLLLLQTFWVELDGYCLGSHICSSALVLFYFSSFHKNIFVYLLVVPGLHCCSGAALSCGARAPHHGDFSCCRAWVLQLVGFSGPLAPEHRLNSYDTWV